MAVLDVMKKRSSVRTFEDKPVAREALLSVLEAARVAPSACNRQPWHFIVVQDTEIKARIAPAWVAKAPAVIVACGNHKESWRRRDGKDHCNIDIAIAVDHISLAAADAGLGTCWVCWFDAFECAGALKLPEHIEPIALIPIGYPASASDPDRHDEKRKAIDEIVSWNVFAPASES